MPSETQKTLALLRRFESRNVTFVDPDGSWPIVWKRAQGNYVWDAEGRKFLDLTAAFGVAAAGHANPRVVRAGQRQLAELPHAMGDVHPHALKALLAQRLSGVTFERWGRVNRAPPPLRPTHRSPKPQRGKVIFCNSGFEAVEAALKTALLATGRKDLIAFEGGYHGLGYGALNATHRAHFRNHFLTQLGGFGHFVRFPVTRAELAQTEESIVQLLGRQKIGAILVEPVQTRGGINVSAADLLPMLRRVCDGHGCLLVLDEIYTGFGRTGRWFACEHAKVTPDIICLGKALTGGFPLSACIGRADLMDQAWPPSGGEAIHTSTFLGNPVGCAMALAQIGEIERQGLVERAAELGGYLLSALKETPAPPGLVLATRGLGLLAGMEIRLASGGPGSEVALKLVKRMLGKGLIVLPEGEAANVISFTPPLTITKEQVNRTVHVLRSLLEVS